VDIDLFGFYSDMYKDRYGFRPRGHVTRKQVQDWIDSMKDVPWNEDDYFEDDYCVGSEDFTCVNELVSDDPLPYDQYDDAFYLKGKR
jgi:hypothetical protein